jgi:chromate reductase, NAD(P)H dehydrogenase (quinone)
MSTPIRILAFAGSLRRDSLNKKLVRVAAEDARAAGAEVTLIDLRDFEMPVYDGDLEAASGLPDVVRRFKTLMIEHDAFLISTPEYNSSIPGVLKNTIDWASRAEPGEKPLACFERKVAGLVSASPGMLGAVRSLVTVRAILENLRVLVIPEHVAVGKAHEAFGAEGNLIDAKRAESVRNVAARLVHVVKALKAA